MGNVKVPFSVKMATGTARGGVGVGAVKRFLSSFNCLQALLDLSAMFCGLLLKDKSVVGDEGGGGSRGGGWGGLRLSRPVKRVGGSWKCVQDKHVRSAMQLQQRDYYCWLRSLERLFFL